MQSVQVRKYCRRRQLFILLIIQQCSVYLIIVPRTCALHFSYSFSFMLNKSFIVSVLLVLFSWVLPTWKHLMGAHCLIKKYEVTLSGNNAKPWIDFGLKKKWIRDSIQQRKEKNQSSLCRKNVHELKHHNVYSYICKRCILLM